MANTSKSSNNTILIALVAVGIVVLVGGWWWRKKQEEENALADALPTKEPITCKNRGDGVYSCTGDFSTYDADCRNDFGDCLKTRYPAAKYFLANGIRLEGNVPVEVDVTTRPGAGATPAANNTANNAVVILSGSYSQTGNNAPAPTNNATHNTDSIFGYNPSGIGNDSVFGNNPSGSDNVFGNNPFGY